MRSQFHLALYLSFLWPALALAGGQPQTDTPRAHDPEMEVTLFAAAPDIVHPIGVAFDPRGRLLVIESHTHFRPKGYKGPEQDRIRMLEDTGSGRADRITTFHEGTVATMAIAAHPDGSIYVATRNEVLRLRDTTGAGKADEVRRIAFLETKGNYPHNGLSGLAFDSRGNVYFGMGENFGADYKLVGSDGITVTGGGEGGNLFWCTADGGKLRRVATGFWNPFGVCQDIFGRLFAVDNDPDAMPPCRLVHVVEGGDYGFQFRYGRSGRHPFQSWDGQLPGTLPMVSGVGEAPCQVLSYESDGLSRKYLGSLLVTSWADHRVERYVLKERGASFAADVKPFVQGGKDFRPVGMAVAPDGSLFVSDWVKADYTLHGKGAVWHVRSKKVEKRARPVDPKQALFSLHRPLREAAARQLAAENGRDFLREQLGNLDVRVRAGSLTALVDAGETKLDLHALADKDVDLGPLAVRSLVARGADARRFLKADRRPAVQMEAIGALHEKGDIAALLRYLVSPDPFIRSAAVHQLARFPDLLAALDTRNLSDPLQRVGTLLAWRASGKAEATERVRGFLADADEDVRFLAAKWIADLKLDGYRSQLVEALKDRGLNVRLYFAYSAALARLDGREADEAQMARFFFDRLKDTASPTPLRVLAMQMIPAAYKPLTPELLSGLLSTGEPALQLEAARALGEAPSPKRIAILREAAGNRQLDDEVRAQAILGLSGSAQELSVDLVDLARGDSALLGDEALRALVGTKLSIEQRKTLEDIASRWAKTAPLVARVLGKPFTEGRPPATDLDAWTKRLQGPADAAAGRRIFAHPNLGSCFRCHRVEGRGAEVGPDLSTVGRNAPRHILESILQPSALVAPYYQSWNIETSDGKIRTGLLVKTVLDEYTYLDSKGDLFKLNTRDIVESRPDPKSIMPDGLVDRLTDQEIRDLLAYLYFRR
ncbi:MAG TPA: PVC-type heme-binding CxxCH protein [Gemmataceae bacterium]|nr:PVC-type heme-binding CxxCH protein [Gemmataceae bacterium]